MKRFLLIGLFIVFPTLLYGWDFASHISLSRDMKEIWQDFDPEFYDSLMCDEQIYWGNPRAQMIQKFYYIGTTLPDMFDEAQDAIQEILNALYNARNSVPGWLIQYNYAFYIKDHTRNNIQSKIIFNDPSPNQNIEKIREMVLYAKNHNWNPYKKAMIYGCYVHLLEDVVAHMILQPATFGYGRSIESPELIDENLLASGEVFHEAFTPTYITSWSWTKNTIFSGFNKLGPNNYSTKRAFMEFYSLWVTTGQGGYVGWQDSNFVPVQGFVEAANAVGYNVQNLTRERLESYMHGWGLMLFMAMGYRWNGSDAGAILSHPRWSPTDIADYIADIGDQNITMLNLPVIHDLIGEKLEDMLKQDILALIGFVFEYCTGDEPWPSYFESVSGYDQLWNCVPPSLRPPEYAKYRSAVEYLVNYSTRRKPHLRSTYPTQLLEGLNFEGFIKDMIDGQDYVWYNMEGKDIWSVARKSGLLGGMYGVDPSHEYYLQPGIFKMFFERDGNLAYTEQDIEQDVPSTIELKYDIMPFGNTRIYIDGKKEDQTWAWLVKHDISQEYNHIQSSLSLNTQNAVNNGYRKIYFDVRTRAIYDPSRYHTMLLSNYEEAFNSTPAISQNQLYINILKNGNPIRVAGEDPLQNPKSYWPYTLPLNPVVTVLASPTNLQTQIYQDSMVRLTWVDNSEFNIGYEIKRKDVGEDTYDNWGIYQDTVSDIDDGVDTLHPAYIYWARAFDDGWAHTSAWSKPDTVRFDNTPPNVNITSPGQYRVVYEGSFTVKWNASDDFGYGISSQKLYYPNQSVNLEGDVRSKEVNFYISGKGSEENIKLEAMDYAVNAGEDSNKAVIIDPTQTDIPLYCDHNDNWNVRLYGPGGIREPSPWDTIQFDRVYKGIEDNWERIDLISPTFEWWDPDPLGEGKTRNYLVCKNNFNNLSKMVTVYRPYEPHPCPVLYTFTGDSFELDNSLLPASEFTHQLTRDYYILKKEPEAINGKYKFKIIEGVDNTYIDLIKLRVIDHPRRLKVEALPNGKIIPFIPSILPFSAIDKKGRDWKDSLLTEGYGYYHGRKGDSLDILFNQEGGYLYSILAKPKDSIMVLSGDSQSDILYSRMNGSNILLPCADSAIRFLPQDSLCRIDYVRKAIRLPDFLIREKASLPIDLPQEVTAEDNEYYHLSPGDTLEFSFDVSDSNPFLTRSYCLEVVGYYLPVDNSKNSEEKLEIEPIYESYIKPASSLITGNLLLSVSSNERREAKIEVIDRIGRIVKRKDIMLNRGKRTIDLGRMTSGIYFIKVSSGKEQIYKVTVIR